MIRRSARHDIIVFAVLLLGCVILWFVPAPKSGTENDGIRTRAKVVSADDSAVEVHGLLKYGTQSLQVEILEGPWKGRTFRAENIIRAQMELDKVFKPGDTILTVLQQGDTPEHSVIRAQDHDRSGWTFLLAGLFCLFLCVFGGWTGVKALFSFFLSCMVIWKGVIPLVLKGWNASWTIFAFVCLLTAAIMYLVAGINRKGTAAFLGAITGVFAGLLMSHLFTAVMKINGAVLPYSQTLYYSGFSFLDLQDLFTGALILASSGAVMDLAMDIASGVEEVARHNPELPSKALTASGMRIGRSVVGTMTTTLLLAYSGGYITLLMMFSAQGSSLIEILNNPLVASESVKTLIGSFSLVLVAPFTAIFAGFLIRGKYLQKRPDSIQENHENNSH